MAIEHKEIKGFNYKLVQASHHNGLYSCTGCMFDSKISNGDGITCSLIKKDGRYSGHSLGCTIEDTGVNEEPEFLIFVHSVSKLLKEL